MGQVRTTWDGEPVSNEPPFGATVIVYRKSEKGYEFLLLHRAHNGPSIKLKPLPKIQSA